MKIYPILALCCVMCINFTLSAQKIDDQPKLYHQLLDEGWHRKEIDRLMQTYLQENSGLPSKKDDFGVPLPQPNPEFLKNTIQVHRWVDAYREDYEKFSKTFPEAENSSTIIKAEKTSPNGEIKRQRGQWKHIEMYATSGRIYDLELQPENAKVMYANPDGDGIFKTTDGGLSWKAITDNIPDRLHRNAYENIIVDPMDFDHVFSISRFGNMYETNDGGASWTKVVNKNHVEGRAPQFKWVEAFRDSSNELILIGTVTKKSGLNHGWEQGVYRSFDNGYSWTKISLEGEKFQEMAFHKTNKDVLYLANTSKLYKSSDAGASFEQVYDFKFGNRPMFIATLSGSHADALYVVVSKGDQTQVYFSSNQGKSWDLRQDSENKVGYETGIFGGHGSSGWTSFFAVDPFDKDHLVASNVSSCESFDGGKTWANQPWYTRANAQMPDGTRPLAPHGSHNADNHVLKFHPQMQGLMVKGCDAGIMMKEKADTNWVNINGNMPAFLWYSVVVNEFGDRYIAGNTQDVNIQTFRYNQWENDRGYEGDAIFMNPSTNTSYFPVAKTEEGEGLNFLEPGYWKMHSWNYPKVAPNYKNLDQLYIAYGRRLTESEPQLPKYLYVTHNRGISYERVPNMEDKEVFSVNVSRTKQPILTAFTKSDVMTSMDGGENWKVKIYPPEFKWAKNTRKVSGCVNPRYPEQMWVGGDHGEIYSSSDGGDSWTSIKGSLPDGQVLELVHHEGTSGDLYVLIKGYGVFYKGSKDADWRLWMDGFNLADFTEIRIDYPCQKLLASSYGRGLWEADLEKTVDRFFKDDLMIVSKGKVNGRFVFQLDTELQIPAYYNYNWTINGEKAGTNSQVLIASRIKTGDLIKVDLSPVYSSDVVVNATLEVEEIPKRKISVSKQTSSFYKDHFIDAGYIDLFGANQNFTFSTWIKPITEGVVVANRRTFYRDAKGWYLEVSKEGKLHFNAAFYQNRSLEKTFGKGLDQSISITSEEGIIEFNKWTHLSVTINREKEIILYVNGKVVANQSLDEIPAGLSLNSVFNLSLLADSYGKRKMIAEIRNMAIYTKELNDSDVWNLFKKDRLNSDDLAFYIDFHEENTELFTNRKIKLKDENYLRTVVDRDKSNDD